MLWVMVSMAAGDKGEPVGAARTDVVRIADAVKCEVYV